MTVKQLIEELKKYPENMDVFVGERLTDFTYGFVNSVESKEINFMEEVGGEPLSKDTVVVICED